MADVRIDVLQLQRGNLPGPQAQPGQRGQHRQVPAAVAGGSVAAIQHRLDLGGSSGCGSRTSRQAAIEGTAELMISPSFAGSGG